MIKEDEKVNPKECVRDKDKIRDRFSYEVIKKVKRIK